MSKIEVDAIDKQSGSTLTLGGSGTAVTLACGATQTGFGRTGTVDWQTSIKTTGFTAVSGEGYFCDTSSGGFTLTLPASPSAGDIVAFKDYANTFDTGTLTIGRNGSNIGGQAIDSSISTEGIAVTLVYADATKGWLVTDSGLQSEAPGPLFISATGGTVSTVCTNFKVHTFTGPGTFCVSCAGNSAGSNKVSYLVVAGGGGSGQYYGGGGGGGGFRESKSPDTPYTASPLDETNGLTVSATGFPITVGGGGAKGGPSYQPGVKGNNTTFSSITSTGGGFGGGSQPSGAVGGPGGSGGGGGGTSGGAGGSGNTPPVSPPQGKDGATVGGSLAGGGGGATGVGGDNPDKKQGGATTNITNSPVSYSGGGGGGPEASTAISPCGSGGVNTPSPVSPSTLRCGQTNRGGGGGADGGAGGSGVVVIRYKFQ
jgi:hypothetical protein